VPRQDCRQIAGRGDWQVARGASPSERSRSWRPRAEALPESVLQRWMAFKRLSPIKPISAWGRAGSSPPSDATCQWSAIESPPPSDHCASKLRCCCSPEPLLRGQFVDRTFGQQHEDLRITPDVCCKIQSVCTPRITRPWLAGLRNRRQSKKNTT